MRARSALLGWPIVTALIALGANMLAAGMTDVTIGLMRSRTPFADAVREADLARLPIFNAFVYPAATAALVWYLTPVVRHVRRHQGGAAGALVARRTVSAPVVVALIGFLPWLLSAILFPLLTLIHFGHWAPELASQQIVSPLVNGFLAATTIYLLLDWLFRSAVAPRIFPDGGASDVPGSLALGVRGRLLVVLLAAAFTPLFTVLGLIRAAGARVSGGADVAATLAALQHASQVTFVVYVGLGVAFTLLLARTLTRPLREAAGALRRIQAGDLGARVTATASDEIGVLEDGVNVMAATLQDRQRILRTFGRIVEPAVRDHLLAGELRLGGEVRFASALFCDLRGFTALSERLAPTETVRLLNDFFAVAAGVARAEGGFVDKFMGDAMLVVFGLFGTQHDGERAAAAAAALRCALALPARLDALNATRAGTGQVPLAFSVGLASGDVVAGTIGAEDRLEYTVIGDAVNVAARLQEAAKHTGHTLCVTETTLRLAAQAGAVLPAVAFADVAVRGRAAPVRVATL